MAIAVAIALLAPAGASAAAPDGEGPWADSVVHADQGTRKDGSPVLPDRSNPQSAVGPAENRPNAARTFFSLGFDDPQTSVNDPGEITLGFDNVICDKAGADLALQENTKEPYSVELADVYGGPTVASMVKLADNIDKDATIDIAAKTTHVKFVRIVDQTPRSSTWDRAADAYDVDGVRGVRTESACGTFTGGARGAVLEYPSSPLPLPPSPLVFAISNGGDGICQDDSDAVLDPTLGSGGFSANPKTVYAETDNSPAGQPGCYSEAGAEEATLTGGGNTVRIGAVQSAARVACDGTTPQLTSQSAVATIQLPGQPTQAIGTNRVELGPVPGIGTIILNDTVTSPGKVTQRAVTVRTTLGFNVYIAEATADHEGNPCQT